jgi:hypothetical protein
MLPPSVTENEGGTAMPESSERRSRIGCGCLHVAALVLVLLVAGAYYAYYGEPGCSMHCLNQLQQISLAVHCYAQAYHCLPPAYIADHDGHPLLSWRVLILPYLGENDVFKKVRLNEPWDSPHNREVFQKATGPNYYFHCCSATSPECDTSYVMVVGRNMTSDGPHSVRLGDIKDGASNTILLVEIKNSGIHWAEPRDLAFDSMSFRVNDPNWKGVGSYHNGVAHVALCDASIRSINDNFEPRVLKSLLTINGSEDVSAFINQP